MNFFSTSLLAVSLAIASSVAASAAGISLNPTGFTSSVRSVANDGLFPEAEDVLFPASTPFSDSHGVAEGGSSSSSVYNFTDTVLDIRFDHSREATEFSLGFSQGTLYFTVDADVGYTLDGSYVANDLEGLTVYQRAYLYDETDGLFLFAGLQQSRVTPNESFLLGLAEGDFSNSVAGSLTGTLVTGHTYEFYYRSYINTFPTPGGAPASANGFVRLILTPEPSSAVLLAFGLAGLAARRRRGAAERLVL
jgi:hypothetical protein